MAPRPKASNKSKVASKKVQKKSLNIWYALIAVLVVAAAGIGIIYYSQAAPPPPLPQHVTRTLYCNAGKCYESPKQGATRQSVRTTSATGCRLTTGGNYTYTTGYSKNRSFCTYP